MRCIFTAILAISISSLAGAQVSERLSSGVYRVYPSLQARAQAVPSMALSRRRRGHKIENSGVPDAPTFGFSQDLGYSAKFAIPSDTDLYGAGEAAGPLRRNGRVIECWNSDIPGYTQDTPHLYQSHPWVLAVRKDGTSFGVLADTTYRCRIDLRNGIEFDAAGTPFPVILIEKNTPQEVVEALADLTGHMNLPPEWALGYHQCRWSYMSADEALDVAKQFRQKHIPCDAIWFDIDYMNGFRDFTFDPQRFPEPKGLNAQLAAMNFHNVWMIDVGIKQEPGYAVYDSGEQQDVFVHDPSGKDVIGQVWPGDCAFPDFTRPQTRSWWSDLYKPFIAQGITGVWNDMNEPSFFNVPTKTMPENAWHRGGGGLPAGPHAEYHNVYGMLEARATYEGMLKANPTHRPFVLTRAGYVGYQRYAATWTGDNTSTWRDLQNAIPMALNLGLSGQPFVGPDIPGFGEDGPTDPAERTQFFSRWWGVGSLLPFCRGHAAKGTERKEPWAFGPDVEEAAREALDRRYELMPYVYTAFWEASKTGLPVARPLFFADPLDPALRAEDRGFLLGDDLAVAAKVTKDDQPIAMPKGWAPLTLGEKDQNLPAIYMRPGSIVAIARPQDSIGVNPPLFDHLIVNLDAKGRAKGQVYEDAGDGFGYKHGDYRLAEFTAEKQGGRYVVKAKTLSGGRRYKPRAIDADFYDKGVFTRSVNLAGQ